MKVLNLQCAHQHAFEGWFGSEAEFTGQLERGLVTCPLCGDAQIQKMLSAPRLNLRALREAPQESAASAVALNHPAPANPELAALQARMLRSLREVVAKSEDVGERFPSEARAMHHGEVAQRHIRGQASAQEAIELMEEGIELLPLSMLPAIKETLQ